jgi:uncharacterized protein YggU (UPF0235/DUF167 family)
MGKKAEEKIVQARIHAGSSKRGIERKEKILHIYTPKKPFRGEANSDAIRILSDYYNVAKSRISILSGQKSRDKVFLIADPD